MCMEDEWIGRKKYIRTTAVQAVVGSTVPACPQAQTRTHILFATAAGQVIVRPREFDAVTDAGFVVGASVPPVNLDSRDHGQLTTLAFVAESIGVNNIILVVETFLDDPKSFPNGG